MFTSLTEWEYNPKAINNYRISSPVVLEESDTWPRRFHRARDAHTPSPRARVHPDPRRALRPPQLYGFRRLSRSRWFSTLQHSHLFPGYSRGYDRRASCLPLDHHDLLYEVLPNPRSRRYPIPSSSRYRSEDCRGDFWLRSNWKITNL